MNTTNNPQGTNENNEAAGKPQKESPKQNPQPQPSKSKEVPDTTHPHQHRQPDAKPNK